VSFSHGLFGIAAARVYLAVVFPPLRLVSIREPAGTTNPLLSGWRPWRYCPCLGKAPFRDQLQEPNSLPVQLALSFLVVGVR